ncbi:aldose epimerase [Dyella monticola]|uniref:Aldose epimerase n=1 Tax=Dyella monticola TaxID=1927958 RepID=A0A370WS93_9GAMM|nr:aldose epimerase [Dyella monticola]RDS78990.1 aldose epimerase [Dyella monticola]
MDAFHIETTHWGSHEIVVLRDTRQNRCVCVARRGATVVSFEQSIDGLMRQLIDGYRDGAELDTRPSSRFAIMVPFANRIDDARYAFDGRNYDTQPNVQGAERAMRHGFVRGVDFDVASAQADADGAHVVFTTSAIRPGAFPGYPFAIDLSIAYTLDANGLSLQACMRNAGDSVAPCFFGWHPYFRAGDTDVDTWELEVPATHLIRTTSDNIPLPGADAFQSLNDAPPSLDFRKPKPIGPTKIDNGYAHLIFDADARARTRLRDPASGLRISMWQERGVVLVFTADTITRDVRRSVAMEPMESMSNAFNRADCADTVRLQPGAERVFRCGVEIDRT